MLDIQSELNKGTRIKLYLPKTQPSAWFIPAIVLNEHQKVIILDDDESIHEVWRERFRQFMGMTNKTIKASHFYSPNEFINWQNAQSEKNIHPSIFLCDYEFVACSRNRIDFITKLKLNYFSVLVTSRFNSEEV